MEQEAAYFIKTAYDYFPKGISDEDPIYLNTPEHRHLLKILKEREPLDKKWRMLLRELKADFHCEFIGVSDRIPRGYRIAIVSEKSGRHYVVVNVSKLIPFYCFYTRSRLEEVKASQSGFLTFSDFNPEDQEIINLLRKKIQAYFDGYTEFPSHLVRTEIKDVEYEDKGELDASEFKRTNPEPMTLFTAFFSTNIFY